jgi:hypothetical protein
MSMVGLEEVKAHFLTAKARIEAARKFMLGAAPQTALPIERTVTLPTWSHLTLNIPYAFPLKRAVSFFILTGDV